MLLKSSLGRGSGLNGGLSRLHTLPEPQEVTFFGNRAFAGALRWGRCYWIGMGPEPTD